MSTAAGFLPSVCPHDCPSTCALEIERLAPDRIGRVRGAADNSYTAGVICSKVARYAERIHHPERLTRPLRRRGAKGSGEFEPIDWDAALDEVAEAFLAAERRDGPEAVWPYYFAGTMGLVMRDGINRLRHAKRYSGQHLTICTTLPLTGFLAGAGRQTGVDPREMAESDVIVLWGTNAAATQVNVMTHASRARRERGATLVCVDTYRNATAKQVDRFVRVRPGTDGALACAIMHVLFRDGHADRDYLARYSDCPDELEAHLATRDPAWAAAICGVPAAEIEALATLIGSHPRTFFRLGYGFARQRNGAVNMHAAASIPVVTGAWRHRGGGALYSNSGIYHWDRTLIDGLDVRDASVRVLDMSRIGAVLTGDAQALRGGPPVSAMLIQNTNPMSVAPDLNVVQRGFAREDLFTCVHEQFMTETARMADIVLPATMFLEHDDLYQGGGHQHILFGPRIVDPPGECRSNHEVVCGLAERLGAEHRGFAMSPRAIIDETLEASGWGGLERLERERWIDCQPDFDTAHFSAGFGHADRRWHFAPDWAASAAPGFVDAAVVADMPRLPDHWAAIEAPDATHPFRLVTAPARHYLNSTFNETPTSRRRQRRPTVMIHPEDAAGLGVADGQQVTLANERGEVRLAAEHFDGVSRGVVVVESIWPNDAFPGGLGINALTRAAPGAPLGGGVFHDAHVAIRTV
ncbi:MAG: molybdopterin-containing oxidoreductase family protein [Gammaproteobacteria bacterium]